MALPFSVKQGDLPTAIFLMRALPEMQEVRPCREYARRLQGVPHLILVAFADQKPVGFKLGYERDGYFYSWLGGVLPDYRRQGIARALAAEQEAWARQQGYDSVTFKTRNRHKAMLSFALNNGFYLISVEEREDPMESRIWLKKAL